MDGRERMDRRGHTDGQERVDGSKGGPRMDLEGRIEGRNAVIEALRAGTAIDKIWIQKGETDRTLGHIASKGREAGAVVVEADKRKLDAMSVTHAHQGVIASAAARPYASVEDILSAARERGEPPLILILDEIEDPRNLGAAMRSAEHLGAHGVVIPKRRSAGLGAAAAKTSAGAVFHVPVARASNLASLLEGLKKDGIWVYGAAAEAGTPIWEADLRGPAAVVIGNEGRGLGRLVKERCDLLVSIPGGGRVGSLNASAAAAVALYEALRQRS